MGVVNINSAKGAPKIVSDVLDELNNARDNVESVIITYTLKDDDRLYNAWSGDRGTILLGLLRCTEDDILNSMRD